MSRGGGGGGGGRGGGGGGGRGRGSDSRSNQTAGGRGGGQSSGGRVGGQAPGGRGVGQAPGGRGAPARGGGRGGSQGYDGRGQSQASGDRQISEGRGTGVSGRGNASVSSTGLAPASMSGSTSSTVSTQSGKAPTSSASAAALSREIEQRLTLAPSSGKMSKFPARPGFGTAGKKCMVRANHFLVQVKDIDLHHYDVTISPEVASKSVNREIINSLVCKYKESHMGKRTPAYDGRKSLFTAAPLPFVSKEFVVVLGSKDSTASSSGSKRKEREFKVAIKLASTLDVSLIQQFLNKKHSDAPYDIIQALDVVMRETPSKYYVPVGRSFFSADLGPKGYLDNGVEYWRGFYQSLRVTQMGLSLNIDVSARPFYEAIPVIEFVQKYLKIRELSRPFSEQDRVKVRKVLKSLKVEVTIGSSIRKYKVSNVTTQPLRQLTFALDDQQTNTSVVQYYRDRYNISLKFTSWPALQAGSDARPIYLPMELCRIDDKQRYSKKLNENQVSLLLKATCQRPALREGNIVKMVENSNYNTNELVSEEFGLQVNPEPTLVDARILPPPMLKYHETGRESRVDPVLGQWNMINKKMVNGGKVESWACANFSGRMDNDFAGEFCRQLVEMCISKGMVFNRNPLLPISSAHPNQVDKCLRHIHAQSTGNLQLLIVILPDMGRAYDTIKRICETELGIVSQCCRPQQASKLNKQYMENLSLKINVKVGGRNTVLNDAFQRRIPLLSDRPTIVFGADVTHPQPGEDCSPSIAAVVASMDWPEVTKYRGIVSAQTHREEIIQDLYKEIPDGNGGMKPAGMIRELLIAFRRLTGYKPHRIIFYRDGVSEGQFNHVLLYEMEALRKACNSLEEGYLPPVTFVVVQKRHHTRFFPADHNRRDLTDRSGNVLPGTVVDTKICHPTEFDFYLNSHAGIQGTSRPTHYHVLFDENRFTADALQTLTNSLCYTYARCTRSVSIVPPAYYAHLAAFRARNYIEGDYSDGESTAGGAGGDRPLVVKPLPEVKENVKDVMFFC